MIDVVSAIIIRCDLNVGAPSAALKPRILLQQRSLSKSQFPLHWETPGGKVENGEEPWIALRRELNEELGLPRACCTYVHTGQCDRVTFLRNEYDTPDDFTMVFFHVCVPPDWTPQLNDAIGLGWFTNAEFKGLQLSPGTAWALARLNA